MEVVDTEPELKLMICISKKVYYTRKAAKAGKREMQKKHGAKMRIYRCEVCGLLHLATVKTEEKERESIT